MIAGGGIVAWSAAAALKRRIPSFRVTVVARPAGRRRACRPDDQHLAVDRRFPCATSASPTRTRSSAREAAAAWDLLRGMGGGSPAYVHAYGSYGTAIRARLLHQLWLRAPRVEKWRLVRPIFGGGGDRAPEPVRRRGAADERRAGDRLRAAADPPRYHALMRAYALHLGVNERPALSLDVRTPQRGRVHR